jgi:hypothetical protein
MMPALMIGQLRNGKLRPALLLASATVVMAALILAPFVAIAGIGAFSWLEYAIARSVQIESVPGAIALLANVMGGPDARIYHGFGTWQVESPLLSILSPTWTLFTGGLVIALALAIWHRYRVERVEFGGLVPRTQINQLLAALMVVLVSARVLSPQYLFWVVPFVALSSRPKTLFFLATCLVTTFVYPLNYQEYMNQEAYAVVATNIRNAMLVAFTIWVIAPDVLAALSSIRTRFSPAATAPSS